MKNKFTAAILALSCAITMTACTNSTATTRNAPALSAVDHEAKVEDTLQTLNDASVIRLKKDFISWGDHWTVYADDTAVGYVNGKAIRLLDVYEFTDMNGVLIASEEENWKVLNATANLKNWQGQQEGRIEQEIFTMLAKLRIYRGDTQIGTIDQKFDFGMNAQIVNGDNTEWALRGKVFTAGADLTLTRSHGDTTVTPLEAMWASLILHEITATSSSNNSSHNNTNK